jgi:hypothetical protein
MKSIKHRLKTEDKLKYYYSDSLPVKFGAPLGSELRPCLFFNMYVNDLPKLKGGRTITYAEDTSIPNVGRNVDELGKSKQ